MVSDKIAITGAALTKPPNDGTINGADTNRSIGHTSDREGSGRAVCTKKGENELKERGKKVNKCIETNKRCLVQPAVTVVF